MRSHSQLEAFGRTLRVSSLERVLWPMANFTKRDLLDYLSAVATVMVPHVAGRAMTLARFPEGVTGRGWFQTNAPRGRPDWIPVLHVEGRAGQHFEYAVLNEPAAVLWAANQGAVEFHPAQKNDALVFDLDPGETAGLAECCDVALRLRGRLHLPMVVKTSGLAGLHVFAALDAPISFAALKQSAREMAEALEADDPPRIVARMSRALRPGKVFIDWAQNDETKSMAAPYSPRAAQLPFISTPVSWAEIEEAARSRDERPLRFLPPDVVKRVQTLGDLFHPDTPRAVS
jgi:bifunctional non-homologous end joining protein LigD